MGAWLQREITHQRMVLGSAEEDGSDKKSMDFEGKRVEATDSRNCHTKVFYYQFCLQGAKEAYQTNLANLQRRLLGCE